MLSLFARYLAAAITVVALYVWLGMSPSYAVGVAFVVVGLVISLDQADVVRESAEVTTAAEKDELATHRINVALAAMNAKQEAARKEVAAEMQRFVKETLPVEIDLLVKRALIERERANRRRNGRNDNRDDDRDELIAIVPVRDQPTVRNDDAAGGGGYTPPNTAFLSPPTK